MDVSLMDNKSLYFFHQLCQIPRGSGNEEAVSRWICGWAQSEGLEARCDKAWNVIIHKPASPGVNGCRPLILQAHLDMVCDKTPDSLHDFTNDPIPWNVEGDWISSAAGTSLGADCGIGVAAILTALEAKDWHHPPLEVLLTTREETDFLGAYSLDLSDILSKRMINLDTSPDNRLLCGSCGGASVKLSLPLDRTSADGPLTAFRLSIEGLQGGHSGSDIDKGRGNAIIILARVLSLLYAEIPRLLLFSCTGGNADVAIPREASAIIAVAPGEEKILSDVCTKTELLLAEEYRAAFPGFCISLARNTDALPNPLSPGSSEKLLDACLLFPNGIQEMEPLLEGNVESSANLGVMQTELSEVHLISVIRAAHPSTLTELIEKSTRLIRRLDGQISVYNHYPSWPYRPDSALRDLVSTVFTGLTGEKMAVKITHAGNEVGIFSDRIPGLDAVSMGPTRIAFHSPEEKLSISSTIRFESFFRQVLEQLTHSESGGTP